MDSSSMVAYLQGEQGEDVDKVDFALDQKQAVLPPVVLSELISDPKLSKSTVELILEIPLLETQGGYWERSGRLRSRLLSKGARAKLADVLISQSCIDHGVSLITRDKDFIKFQDLGGLKLL